MNLLQERKYDVLIIEGIGRIVNRATGKPIPENEPVMIFRAKDRKSIPMLEFYRDSVADGNHATVVQVRIDEFAKFQDENPDLVKEPDSSTHCLP